MSRNLVWRIVRTLAVVIVVVVAVLWLTSRLPSLDPFRTKTIDESQPVLLQSIRDLSQYHAAVGDFQVVVALEHDFPFLPDFLAGNRTLFVAAGTVNAYVNFAGLDADALVVDAANRSVEIRLPPPSLDKPNLDQERTYLFAQQRGAWDRVKAIFETPGQQEFYVLAEKKLSAAAREAGLIKRAAANTRAMLTGMFQSLGYRVTFSPGA